MHTASTSKKLIYDDDCANDSDCVYTLAALHHWIDTGDVNVLAFIADSGSAYSAPIFKIFENYYGHTSIPIGTYTGSNVGSGYQSTSWTLPTVSQFDPGDTSSNYPSCVTTYRTALASAANNSVNIAETGFLSCISQVMQSSGDSISPLTGAQLLQQKVAGLYVMGGDYPTGNEFNMQGDPTDANYVFTNWTSSNGYPPIYLNGYTPGSYLSIGIPSWFTSANPAAYAQGVAGSTNRPGWDALSVFQAIFGTSTFTTSSNGTNSVNASNGANTWSSSTASGQYYLTLGNPASYYDALIDGQSNAGAAWYYPESLSGTLTAPSFQCNTLTGCQTASVHSNSGSGSTSGLSATVNTTAIGGALSLTNNANATYLESFTNMAPNLTSGNAIENILGVSASTNDWGSMNFDYAGSGSSNNRIGFGFYGTPEYLNILANGNVGIGTTNPTSLLTVNGSEQITNNGALLLNRDTTSDYTNTIFQTGGTTQFSVGLRSGDQGLHFYNDANSADRMVIASNGNVGIGTTTPGSLFAVNNVANFATGGSTFYSGLNILGGATLSNATTSDFAITNVASSLLKTDAAGNVVPAVAGVDFAPAGAATFAYLFPGGATTTQLAFNGGLTTTNATATTFAITSLSNSLLKVNASGSVVPAISGVDYAAPSSLFSYLFPSNATTTSIGFNGGLTASNIAATSATATSLYATSFAANTASTTDLITPGLPNLTANVEGTGVPGLDGTPNGWTIYNAPTSATANNPLDTFKVERLANYSGGDSSTNRSGISVTDTIANAGEADNEWAINAQLNNGSTAAAPTGSGAGHFAASKTAADASGTWGLISSCDEKSGQIDPGSQCVAGEFDVFANGTDYDEQRVGASFFIGQDATAGTAHAHGYAALFAAPAGDSQWDNILVGQGPSVNGVDLSGMTITNNAFASPNFEVTGNGWIGIGTSTPGSPLSIDGIANFTASGSTFYSGLKILGTTTLASATTSSFAITNVTSSLLKTTTDGSVVPAVAGVDYASPSSLFGYLFPGNATTTPIGFNGGLTASSISATNATSTSFAITGLTSTLLKTDASGNVVPAIAGTDYLTSLSGAASSTLLSDNNTWSGNNVFNDGLTALASSTIGDGTLGLTVNGNATTTGTSFFGGNVGIGTTNPATTLEVTSLATPTTYLRYDATNGTLTFNTNGLGSAISAPGANTLQMTAATCSSRAMAAGSCRVRSTMRPIPRIRSWETPALASSVPITDSSSASPLAVPSRRDSPTTDLASAPQPPARSYRSAIRMASTSRPQPLPLTRPVASISQADASQSAATVSHSQTLQALSTLPRKSTAR